MLGIKAQSLVPASQAANHWATSSDNWQNTDPNQLGKEIKRFMWLSLPSHSPSLKEVRVRRATQAGTEADTMEESWLLVCLACLRLQIRNICPGAPPHQLAIKKMSQRLATGQSNWGNPSIQTPLDNPASWSQLEKPAISMPYAYFHWNICQNV